MTKALKQSAKVRTNATPNSICKIQIEAVKFADLWNNYVDGSPYKPEPNDKGDYSNQCALRMSATFHRAGVQMKSFSQRSVKPMPGAQTLGRVMMDGYPAAVRAYELGEWLKLQPFCGLPQEPENITGKGWESKVKGRTGIIMFHAYWARAGETPVNASGGHIDLWNGQRMTVSGPEGFLVMLGRRIGISNAHIPGTSIGYSDLGNARLILFWEIK
jgi:hypothetical protein